LASQHTADHVVLVTKLDKVGDIVAGIKEGDSVSELLEELIEYETMMKPHLLQEEIECLPLARAYFTQAEMGEQSQKIVAKASNLELGSLINTSK